VKRGDTRAGRDGRSLGAALDEIGATDDGVTRLRIVERTLGFLSSGVDEGVSGWLRVAAPDPRNDSVALPYLMNFGSARDARPVVVIVPPLERDAWHAAMATASPAGEAMARGWVVIGVDPPDRPRGPARVARVLDAIVSDAAGRAPGCIDQSRVCLVGWGDSASVVLSAALAMPGRFAGVGLIDANGALSRGDWGAMLARVVPRPALFVFSSVAPMSAGVADALTRVVVRLDPADGAWRRRSAAPRARRDAFGEMCRFLAAHPLDGNPAAVAATTDAPGRTRSGWLRVREAEDFARAGRAVARAATTNTLVVSTSNVHSFELALSELPRLRPGRPIVLRVDGQRLRIIGPQTPGAVRLSKGGGADRPRRWRAEEIDRAAFDADSPKALSRLTGAGMPPVPNAAGEGGVARLLAHAARRATGARVAVVPARAMTAGQAEGDVMWSDAVDWAIDAQLSTATVSARVLLRALAIDHAGPRLFVTDGVGALSAEPGAAMGGVDSLDEVAVQQTLPTKLEDLFLASSLDGESGDVTVVAWRGLLDDARSWLGDGLADGPHACGVTQREALLRHLDAEPKISPMSADIRPFPRKVPRTMKRWLEKRPSIADPLE